MKWIQNAEQKVVLLMAVGRPREGWCCLGGRCDRVLHHNTTQTPHENNCSQTLSLVATSSLSTTKDAVEWDQREPVPSRGKSMRAQKVESYRRHLQCMFLLAHSKCATINCLRQQQDARRPCHNYHRGWPTSEK